MKLNRMLLSFLFLGFGFSSHALKTFDHPVFEIDGVPHKIIDEDTWDDDWYDESATGFCFLNGFTRAYQTSAIKGWYGPYVALNKEGEILQAFPDEGNADRFYELSQIICE